eukprot:TRINITY_DN26269_c1_g4_i1.p1 TRINITY_DN26269_c1_g4~~TRINITY_DN26269_c1_g4_i1.p1  ORF type:complete len:707 (-),score=81.95 TRINITY_DN26269_c1_g4_i1:92-2212(-)
MNTMRSEAATSTLDATSQRSKLQDKRRRQLDQAEQMAKTQEKEKLEQLKKEEEMIHARLHGKDQGLTPTTAKRGCTDFVCVLLFVLIIGSAIPVVELFREHSHRLSFRDWHGNNCGTGEENNEPYLYFCRASANSSHVQLRFPICVDACPTSSDDFIKCPVAGQEGLHVNSSNITLEYLQGYPSNPYMNLVCLPEPAVMHEEVTTLVMSCFIYRMIIIRDVLDNDSDFFLFTIVVCLAVCINFVGFMRRYAKAVIFGGLSLIWMTCFVGAAYFTWQSKYQTYNPQAMNQPSESHRMYAILCFGLGLFVLVKTTCQESELDRASACLQTACNILYKEPALLANTFLRLMIRLVTMVCFYRFTKMVLACTPQVEDDMGDAHFEVQWWQYTSVAYIGCVCMWVTDCMISASHFVDSFLTQMYFFPDEDKSDDDSDDHEDADVENHFQSSRDADRARPGLWKNLCILSKTYCVGIRYHFGSFCFGGMLIGLFRPAHFLLGPLYGFVKVNADNPVGELLGLVCCFVMGCFARIEPFGKSAFMNMAMNGGAFCESAYTSRAIMMSDPSMRITLRETVHMFQIACLGIVLLLAHILAALKFELAQVLGLPELQGRISVYVVNYLFALVSASPFTSAFEDVSSNILFSVAIKKSREPQQSVFEQAIDTLTYPLTALSSYIWASDSTTNTPYDVHGSAQGLTSSGNVPEHGVSRA